MLLPICCNNQLPQHFTCQQTLHSTGPPSKPSTPHTIHIISAILPPRRYLQNNPPRGQKQRSRNKHRHYRSLHNPHQILNPHHQARPPLHLRSHIHQNKLPQCIKLYFTDVYLFCVHKDPKDTTKLCPLGIPTAIQHLIASHVAHTLRDKFSSHLLVGASCQSSKVSSKVLPVPLTDVCLSRSVHSGNDGHLGVVPWGASMSLHSVSCVPIIYLCSHSRAP